MIHQFISLVSVTLSAFILKLVAFTILEDHNSPMLPDLFACVRNIFDPVATAVVLTVTTPATSVAVPMDAFVPVAILIFLPTVEMVKFPFAM